MWCGVSHMNLQQHCDLIFRTFIDARNWFRPVQPVQNCTRANDLTLWRSLWSQKTSLFNMLVTSSQQAFFVWSQKWCQQVIQVLIINSAGAGARGEAFKTGWQQWHLIFWWFYEQNFSLACSYKESLNLW